MTGSGGRLLKDYFNSKGGPTAYLGTTVPGFPNFFMMMGELKERGIVPREVDATDIGRELDDMRRLSALLTASEADDCRRFLDERRSSTDDSCRDEGRLL